MLIDFNRDEILTQAHHRVAHRRDVERILKRESAESEQLVECLDLALRCVRTLAKPAVAVIEVDAGEIVSDLKQGDEPLLLTPDVSHLVAKDVEARLYLVTCGFDSREAMRWLNNDYTAYHFQDEIARELVFALARHAYRSVCANYPQYRFARHAIRMETVGSCGGAAGNGATVRLWDPRRISRLLQRFGRAALDVSTTSAGCLTPLHSLLGLMIGTPSVQNFRAEYPARPARESA